jgi:predicted PP-loop superfamily ATPase
MSDKQSYYERFKEERKAYQKAYYDKNKESLKRKKELDASLKPEKLEKVRDYQHNYYLTNRQKLLERKRLRYLERKSA